MTWNGRGMLSQPSPSRVCNRASQRKFLPMRDQYKLYALGIVLIGLLTACQKHSPSVVPVANQTITSPIHVSPNRKVTVTWWFSPEQQCVAKLNGTPISMSVSVTDRWISWVVSGYSYSDDETGQAKRISFSNNSTNWYISVRISQRGSLVSSVRISEYEAARILLLLDGGLLRLGNGTESLLVHVPNASQPGLDWFQCVRKHLLP